MNFTDRQAKSLVVGSIAGAAILASAQQLATGSMPDVRVAVGGVIAGAVLYALADVAPPLAGSLALLVLTGALLTNGADVARVITTATTKDK